MKREETAERPLPLFPDYTLLFSGGVRLFTRHPYYLRAWNRLQLPHGYCWVLEVKHLGPVYMEVGDPR